MHTSGFRPDGVIGADGRVGGLGWDNVLSVSVGVQYAIADDLTVRAGYCWSENPIPREVQFANVVVRYHKGGGVGKMTWEGEKC